MPSRTLVNMKQMTTFRQEASNYRSHSPSGFDNAPHIAQR
nr:MAG TPA: hypothetical protein [Caudoviricetes sp.]